MPKTSERVIGRSCNLHIMLDGDRLLLGGFFEYENGCSQGIGRPVDISLIKNLMHLFDVSKFDNINGKYCWVVLTDGVITRLEPLLSKYGKACIIYELES